MNIYTIKNPQTGEEVIIEAIYAECDTKNRIWEFGVVDEDNKVALCYYNSYNWDIREIKKKKEDDI